jgi:hypothetical protein
MEPRRIKNFFVDCEIMENFVVRLRKWTKSEAGSHTLTTFTLVSSMLPSNKSLLLIIFVVWLFLVSFKIFIRPGNYNIFQYKPESPPEISKKNTVNRNFSDFVVAFARYRTREHNFQVNLTAILESLCSQRCEARLKDNIVCKRFCDFVNDITFEHLDELWLLYKQSGNQLEPFVCSRMFDFMGTSAFSLFVFSLFLPLYSNGHFTISSNGY